MTGVQYLEVNETDTRRIQDAYALLQDVLGTENVEDAASFLRTVSPLTDNAVVPKLVCAVNGRLVNGAVLGAYLTNLNIGMVLYGGVVQRSRGRGVYSTLRSRLIDLLNGVASSRQADGSDRQGHRSKIHYIVSELEEGSPLFEKYVGRRGAYVAPCDYVQPTTQGLSAKELKLVLQPVARKTPPTSDEITTIVREVYRRVYRLSDDMLNPYLLRVVESMGANALSAG